MNPVIAFVGGAVLIWIVANGKADAVWKALTGQSTGNNTQRPPDPSTSIPGGGRWGPNTPPGAA